MKKFVVVILVVASVFSFVSCSKKAETTPLKPIDPTEQIVAPAEKEYKLGMGIVFSDSESNDITYKYDATCAVVITDASGKIVACRIDDAQNAMVKDNVNLEATFRTKVEKQFDYSMVKYSEATKEWFEQAAAFEAYCIGKTGEEVADTALRVREDNHAGYRVAADETLFASCSIQIEDMMAAVEKACNDEQGVSFKSASESFNLGVAITSEVDASSNDDNINIYAEFEGSVVEDGNIIACVTDAIQPKFSVSADEVTYEGTNRELKFDYNMDNL